MAGGDADNIDQLYFTNRSSGNQIATGQVGEVVDLSPNLTVPDGGSADLVVTADLNNSAGISDGDSISTELAQVGSEDEGSTYDTDSENLPVTGSLLTYDTGDLSVDTFDQANDDERVNVNASFTTPGASTNGVNESTITLAIDNQDDRDILVVKNGELTANATDVNTDFDDGGNVTIDADVEVPEDTGGNYTLDLDSNVQDDGGNQIVGSGDISPSGAIDVEMAPAKLEVETDESVFANADGDKAAADENATVNVSVVDRFGNGIRDGTDVNATVSLTSNDNSVSITDTSPTGTTLGTRNGTPFEFTVTNSEAEDVTLTAFDTDASDSQLNSGSGVQTFVGEIAGVDVTMNKSTLFADGNDAAEAQLQLVDANGDAVPKGGVATSFSFDNGSAAGVNVAGTQSPTTNSSGVATVAFTADTQDVTVTATGFEQQTANQYSDSAQITTTAGDIDGGNTNFYFNGNEVTGNSEDVVANDNVQVNTDHDVAVQVNDQNGNNIEGETVSYTLDGTEVASATSDSDGFANATITLPTAVVENAALNASVGPFNASATSDAQVNVTSVAADATKLSVDDTSIATGNDKTVTVSVLDEFDNVNESSTDITLTSSDSSIISVNDGEEDTVAATNGESDFTLTAEATEGSATLTANASGLSEDTATVTIAEVGGVTLTPDSDSIADGVTGASNSTNFTAQVVDSEGNAIDVNRSIRFIGPSDSPAEITGPTQVYSGADGDVTTFRANATDTTGDTEFTARIPGTSYSDRATITTTGSANALTIEAVESQAAVGDNVQVNFSVVDSEGRTVPIDSTNYFAVDTTLGTLDESGSTVDVDATAGTANVSLNGTEAGTASINVFNSDIGDEADTTVEFVETADTGSLTFNDQTLGADGTVTVEDVSTGQNSTVVVTYANGSSEEVVAGVSAANNLAGEDVSVEIEDTGGFPGDHTAWVFNTSDLPSDLGIGANATPVADEALDSETATISEADAGALGVVVEPSTVTANESTDVTVTVTNQSNGEAVEDASVSISDLGLSDTTDANGEVTFSVNASEAGDYPIDVSADGFADVSTTLTVTEAGEVPEIPNVDQETVNGIATKYGDSELTGQDILFAWDDYQDDESLEGVPSATGQDILFLWDGYQNLNN